MKDNRRDFIKKSASLAAAISMAGLNACSSKSNATSIEEGKEPTSQADLAGMAKDAGMEFSLSIRTVDSKRVPFARQMGVNGVVTSLRPENPLLAGLKPWEPKAIKTVKEAWDKTGMKWNVVEGPPTLGEQTKLGLAGRDEEIANFIAFMKNLKEIAGVNVICYNWMPVISWARTQMDRPGRGGALVTAFDYEDVKNKPLTEFGAFTKEALWKNLEYFLKAVVPEAEKIGMNLSLHPDDPQVDSIQGVPRIMNTVENFDRMLKIMPNKYSGLTMCQGNFSLMGTDIPALIRRWGKAGKINFVHFRNVQDLSGKLPSTKFTETFHDEGQIDMYAAMQAYYDIGFKGAIRPDHVPTMYGETNERPGYMDLGTLYAIGYMRALAESVSKTKVKA
ncbi:mannonate dehydratase [Adhaeribacter aquaticus]|uniref:mannonate dehydratase n=1 Tax=Adhaeribacter aquaticus TaxID=299567 RepID=UPI0004156AD6|nr:mannonate dehydratase [Adhaeribacter aquaticus]